MKISQWLVFLCKKAFALLCFVLIFIVVAVLIRAQLFLSNRCPSCNEFLIFYTPQGYYDPLLTNTFTLRKGEISFSFLIDRYGEYTVGLKNINRNEGTFHFSRDIGYSLACESMKTKTFSGMGLPKRGSLENKKIFLKESKLLRMDDALSELDKKNRKRDFFVYHYIPLGGVSAFDAGDWTSGGFYDDIGRQYNCTIKFFMDEDDFFEATLVVDREHPLS
jgi:hypothetical protein